jgi:hypothetical protein
MLRLLFLFLILTVPALASPRIHVVGGETILRDPVRPIARWDTVAITNSGDEPLELTAYSNCGCTLVSLDTPTVAPGDTAHLRILSDLANYDGTDWQKFISIGTNVPGRRSLSLQVRFRVLHDLRVGPYSTEMRRTPCPNGKCVWEVEIMNTGDSLMTLAPPVVDELQGTLVEFVNGEKLRSRPTRLAPGESLKLKMIVTITGGVPHPYTRVMIATSSPYEKELWLGFYYAVEG